MAATASGGNVDALGTTGSSRSNGLSDSPVMPPVGRSLVLAIRSDIVSSRFQREHELPLKEGCITFH
jgi:hypothetical protein